MVLWPKLTTSGTDLDVEGSDADLLAAGSDILGSQHGSVGRGLVTISLDLHATSDTADGFAAGEIGDMDCGVELAITVPERNLLAPLLNNSQLLRLLRPPRQRTTGERQVEAPVGWGNLPKVSLKLAKMRATPLTS